MTADFIAGVMCTSEEMPAKLEFLREIKSANQNWKIREFEKKTLRT